MARKKVTKKKPTPKKIKSKRIKPTMKSTTRPKNGGDT